MKTTKLHKFNELGNHLYVQAVKDASLREDKKNAAKFNRVLNLDIQEMLLDDAYVELIDDDLELDIDLINEGFENQYQFAEYLVAQLGGIDKARSILEDVHLMNWLSLLCLKAITVKTDKFFIIGETSRYVIDYNYHNRHLIRTPLWMFCNIADNFDFALRNTAPAQFSDLIKQFLNHDNIRSFPAALQLGNDIFNYMKSSQHSSHEMREMGSTLTHKISSYLLNYDLWDCSKEELAYVLFNDDNMKPILSQVYNFDYENEEDNLMMNENNFELQC